MGPGVAGCGLGVAHPALIRLICSIAGEDPLRCTYAARRSLSHLASSCEGVVRHAAVRKDPVSLTRRCSTPERTAHGSRCSPGPWMQFQGDERTLPCSFSMY